MKETDSIANIDFSVECYSSNILEFGIMWINAWWADEVHDFFI